MAKHTKWAQRLRNAADSKLALQGEADSTSHELPDVQVAAAPSQESSPEQTTDFHTQAGGVGSAGDLRSCDWGDAEARPVDPIGRVEPPGPFATVYERDFAALPPGADLLSVLEAVKTAEDFSAYAEDLLADFRGNAAAWNNTCLHSFLDAVASSVSYLAWAEGPGGTARAPSWRLFAAILHAARFYGTEDFEEWVEELAAHLFVPTLSSVIIYLTQDC